MYIRKDMDEIRWVSLYIRETQTSFFPFNQHLIFISYVSVRQKLHFVHFPLSINLDLLKK